MSLSKLLGEFVEQVNKNNMDIIGQFNDGLITAVEMANKVLDNEREAVRLLSKSLKERTPAGSEN